MNYLALLLVGLTLSQDILTDEIDAVDDCPECDNPAPANVQLLQQSLLLQKSGKRTLLKVSSEGLTKQETKLSKEGSGTKESKPSDIGTILDGCLGIECLERYVQADDAHFSWRDTSRRLHGSSSGGNWTAAVLHFTSQKWLTESEVTPTIWEHALIVVLPDNPRAVKLDWATLYIAFGFYGSSKYPTETIPHDDADLLAAAEVAVYTGTLAAVLFNVPAEFLTWQAENPKQPEVEDAEVSLTWAAFGGLKRYPTQPAGQPHLADDSTWRPRAELLIELPMTKAIVRAMDAVSAFSGTIGQPITSFGIYGTSKRGAASWHAAAVDRRVRAIAPMVKSLNYRGYADRALRSLGGMPLAARDYFNNGLMSEFLFTREGEMFMNITDPFNYLDRFAIPKLLISASNDEFFVPDHTRVWYDQLPGTTWNLMVPNSHHIVGGKQVEILSGTLASFFKAVMPSSDDKVNTSSSSSSLPNLISHINEETGSINVSLIPHASFLLESVKLWQATTCDDRRRDFRSVNADKAQDCTRCGYQLQTLSGEPRCRNTAVTWSASELPLVGPWLATVEVPTDGRWTGFFLSFSFGSFELSTEVSIVPNTFPFQGCNLKTGCNGAGLVLTEIPLGRKQDAST